MMKDGADAHDLSQEYGPHYQTILKWVRETGYENNPDEQDVKRLKKQNKKLKEENEILKAAAVIMGKKITRTQGMRRIKLLRRQSYRITTILQALKLASSTYYDWLQWKPSPQTKHHEVLRQEVVDTWNDNFRIYGYPRITAAMVQKGINVSQRFVWQLMRESGIKSHMNKRYHKPTTNIDFHQRPNLAHLDHTGNVLYTDITYVQLVNHQCAYLASVFNPHSNRIVAYNLADKMTAQLATKPVVKAHRALPDIKMIHSNMGSQYTSQLFESTLESYVLIHSYSLKGYPYDKAFIENFHSLLKREWVFNHTFTSMAHAKLSIGKYIDWLNSKRISYREIA